MKTFSDFFDHGRFDPLTIDADQSEKLVKLLDAFVIKLEGGTDLDLQVLEAPSIPPPLEPVKVSLSEQQSEWANSLNTFMVYPRLIKVKEQDKPMETEDDCSKKSDQGEEGEEKDEPLSPSKDKEPQESTETKNVALESNNGFLLFIFIICSTIYSIIVFCYYPNSKQA